MLQIKGLRRRSDPIRSKRALETLFDARISKQRERVNLRANKWRGEGKYHKNNDDLRHESQRHFLNLGQSLKSAMPIPASIAASTAGPLAISTVQIAELTISSASASFTGKVLSARRFCAVSVQMNYRNCVSIQILAHAIVSKPAPGFGDIV